MGYFEELQHGKLHGFPEKGKKKNFINKKSVKKIAAEQKRKDDGTDAAEDKWFHDRGKELTGKCLFCGQATEKEKPMEKCSIAHLFAKRKNMFQSIRLHPENSIELCFYGNSCHTNFDSGMIELSTIEWKYPMAWFEIVRKTSILVPCMTQEEKNKVPKILLTAIKNLS